MNIEEARKIAISFMVNEELHQSCRDTDNLDSCDIFKGLKRLILNVDKNARREALESEAVKCLVEASIDAIKALDNLNPRSRLPNLEKALTRFEQFKQEGK